MKKNIVANFIGKFWGIFSNFIFIPLYIKYLGFESYSIISFILIIAGIIAILDSGLTATLSREFARNDNKEEDRIKIYKTLESVYIIVVLLSIVGIVLFSDIIADNWIKVKSYTPSQVSGFLKIISIDVGFQLLLRFYMGGLFGLQKQVMANVYQMLWGMLRNGLVIGVIIYYPDLNTFFIWQSAATLIFTFLMKASLDKIVYKKKINFLFSIDKNVLKNVSHFAGGMLLIAIVAAFNTQMDKIVISKLLSLESLGYYTLAVSLSQGMLAIAGPIATAVLPNFTAYYSLKKITEANDLYNKYALYVSILIFTFLSNIIFFTKPLLWAWTGNLEIVNHVYIILPIVASAYGFVMLQVIPGQVAIANGYTKLNNVLGILSIFITFPGYYFSIKYYQAYGAAVVFLFVQIISTFIYISFINRKFIKENLLNKIFFKQIFIPFIIAFLVSFMLSRIPQIFSESRIISFIWIGIATFLTLMVTSAIVLPREEIKRFFKFKN
ncbi:lipopolysaccharide biosynthesis protein [Chryseobacterium sp. SIMBA_029]|uniref:lipopolysaccharide biosynthesis protein n=1 Tax=Chryseobacterium sp. SIMBA_029 TaxID=3085772 RepID=UPI00397C5BA0